MVKNSKYICQLNIPYHNYVGGYVCGACVSVCVSVCLCVCLCACVCAILLFGLKIKENNIRYDKCHIHPMNNNISYRNSKYIS